MPNFDWEEHISLDQEVYIKNIRQQTPNNEITIMGFGTLTFKDVVAGKILITPYDKKQFLRDSEGNKVTYRREWTLENIDNNCYEYWLDTTIYFPYGGCDLKMYAKGEVSFEFDTIDCTNYLEYISNPNRKETFWGYLKDESLTTSSYKYEDLDNKD